MGIGVDLTFRLCKGSVWVKIWKPLLRGVIVGGGIGE